MRAMNKIVTFEQLKDIRAAHPNKKIVHCHGVFDLFHYGHLLHLQSAKEHGDILVVTVTPDQFVNKGPGRPHYTESKRIQVLAALEIVDHIALNQTPKAIEAILALKPDVYIKGPDYKNKEADRSGGIKEEENAVNSVGGKLAFTNDQVESSSQLINRYMGLWDSKQQEVLETLRTNVGLESAIKEIDALSELKILVVGEPIVDTYVFCRPDSLSSKSPTVSASYLYQEDYTGGSLAIANHLASMGCKVSLLMTHGGEDYFRELLKSNMNPSIDIKDHVLHGIPTPRKTRYMIPFRSQRIFELQNVKADQWIKHNPRLFNWDFQELAREHDIVIMADFGHGLFESDVLRTVKKIETFKALNVQTNSGNFGFNLFTKHESYDYLSIDERECRIALQDRLSPIEELAPKVASYLEDKATSVTLGTEGSMYFDEMGESYRCPTFFKDVVDSTGAGDAYFALTSALVYMQTPQTLIPFLGNCCAGLKTMILGNKHSVSKSDLVRTVTGLLK